MRVELELNMPSEHDFFVKDLRAVVQGKSEKLITLINIFIMKS